MKEQIMNYCIKNLNIFHGMNDIEIYDWICENFYCKDYKIMRECSIQIKNEITKRSDLHNSI